MFISSLLNKKKHIYKQNSGMTLVEAIIAVVIFSVLSLVIMQGSHSFFRFNEYAISQSYQVDFARRGMDVLIKDMREMTFAENGAYPLTDMQPFGIGFYHDATGDGLVDYVEYALVGTTTLIKNIHEFQGGLSGYDFDNPDHVLILSEYVQNQLESRPIFTYYDGLGEPLTDLADITEVRTVRVSLVVNVRPERNPGEFELLGTATLRNLQENI